MLFHHPRHRSLLLCGGNKFLGLRSTHLGQANDSKGKFSKKLRVTLCSCRAFHLLSSLDLLELPIRLARDLEKVHEKAKVAEPYERASLETSRMTFEREFGKAMLVANCAGYHPNDVGDVKSFAEEFKGRRLW